MNDGLITSPVGEVGICLVCGGTIYAYRRKITDQHGRTIYSHPQKWEIFDADSHVHQWIPEKEGATDGKV